MTPAERSDLVRRLAFDAGFDRAGVARARPVARMDYFNDWLARGCAGEMSYLSQHRPLRADPAHLLPGGRSVVVVADTYHHGPAMGAGPRADRFGPASPGPEVPRGRVAQYAWGRDYHRTVRNKLRRLADQLRHALDEPFQTRVCVDTAPIIEREAAAAAGIGWIGKNTMVLSAELGSFFVLGEIVTTLELAPSEPAPDRCGSCTRCLEACPTGALIAPYRMDATRCIAYLTIEHRGEIPPSLQPLMEDWVFGCDVCQEVCPYNRRTPAPSKPACEPNDRNLLVPHPALTELMNLPDRQYRQYLAGSAMKRATRAMLQRNAGIAYRNWQRKKGKGRAAD